MIRHSLFLALLGGSLLGSALLTPSLRAQLPAPYTGMQRCGTVHAQNPIGNAIDHPDCDYNQTNPSAIYAPTSTLRIPVVVHVIQTNNGTGFLSDTLVQSQITVLNEDFRAKPGTPGANGVDSRIEFFLATTDPNGQPTNGIRRYTNNTWFNDAGGYYNSIAWDTSRYLNIYTNQASGSLGYVPDLPQGGSVLGTNADRVVCYYATFGRPGLAGAPYGTGRTASHEVGHYLGLFHTFTGGCGGGSCYSSGDRICDTNAESGPRYGCQPSAQSCGSVDPARNYMDYSDDTCMQGFTSEQVRRMRCTLQHYRSQLAQPAGPLASANSRTGAGNLNSNFFAGPPRLGQTATMSVLTLNTGFNAAVAYGFLGSATQPFQSYTVLVDVTSPQILALPFQVNATFCQWSYSVPVDPAFAGLPIYSQALVFGSTVAFTNAVDLVVGS